MPVMGKEWTSQQRYDEQMRRYVAQEPSQIVGDTDEWGNTYGKTNNDSDKTTTIASPAFDNYKTDYNKSVGSKGGAGVSNDKKFTEKVKKEVDSLQQAGFLKKGKKGLVFDRAGLEGALSAISSGNLKNLTFGKLMGKLNDIELTKGNLFRNIGLGSLINTMGVLENLASTVLDKFGAALLSQLYIPDVVFLGSLIAFDKAGADMEANDNYIRKLVLKRDICCALKWWNETWGIKYTGLIQDVYTTDANIAARCGCHENVAYILGEFYKSYESLTLTAKNEKDPNVKKIIEDNANRIHISIIYCVKLIIVYGYGSFKANDLRNLLNNLKIKPSVFGYSDKTYGCKFAINDGDIEIMAPIYRPFNNGAISQLASLTENRSSKFRRSHGGNTNMGNGKWDFRKSFINPRNNNVKRLYLTLVDEGAFGKDGILYNPKLAERLRLSIMTTLNEALDEGLAGLIPDAFFNIREKVWDSAYIYTKSIEDFLKNPPKMKYIILQDKEVIKSPNAIPSADKNITIIDEKNKLHGLDNTKIKTKTTVMILIDIVGKNLINLPTDINVYINIMASTFSHIDITIHLENVLKEIEDGTITISSVEPIEKLIFEDYLKHGGEVKDFGDTKTVSQKDLATIALLNNNIYNSNRYNTDPNNTDPTVDILNIRDLTTGKTLSEIMSEADYMVKSGQNIIDEMELALLEVYKRLQEMYKLLMDGSMLISDVETLKVLMKEAFELIRSKTDLSDIIELLRSMGVDVSGIDPLMLDIKRNHDFLTNSDPEFFDFDIDNPPVKVIDSMLKEQYGNNCINLQYHWVGSYRIPYTYPEPL